MAHVKKGHLVRAPEWWKHLRKVKRILWKRHRQAEKTEIRTHAVETGRVNSVGPSAGC